MRILFGDELLKKDKIKEYLIDAGFFIVGSLLYAVSIKFFIAPNHIAPGGITGISTILNYLFGTPIGIMILILNIPLLVLSMKVIGGEFTIKTVVSTVLISVAIDAFPLFPEYKGNMLLAAVYGGVLSGVGLALVFLRGATTGGSDLASRLLRKKMPHISMGRMIMVIDVCVIISATIAYRNFEIALYSIISIFTSSKVIDNILYGADNGKLYMIISDKDKEICETVAAELKRGITLIKSKGYYTGKDRELLMCAVRRHEAAKLLSIVRQIDPVAFVITTEAGAIIGEGFRPIHKDS
jgi:uncharacterized membrane-anchored protein YitT (DUF2179 family)